MLAPFPLTEIFGHWGAYGVFLLIGFSFGFVLEMAGFADSPKLAAQFYFKDLTVLKVMFTGIIVAMVLTFFATGVGLLDFNRVWVPPTYLWPGIVGGLLMGVGFIIGGFCPGTSLVALATLKIDGLFFALGALFGIFLFGESVDSFAGFWNSSNMGRFILPELFGVPTGVVVVGVVLMALFMFWGGEHLERIFGGKKMTPSRNFAFGASTLTAVAVMVFFIGQPTVWDRWEQVQPEEEPRLTNREVQIHPGELLGLLEDNTLNTVLLDVRSEADYNLFHLKDATQTDLSDLPGQIPALLNLPASSVVVLMSNDEAQATEAWKILVGSSVPNVYLLEGGVNNWLTVFGPPPGEADYALSQSTTLGEDELRYIFTIATGANTPLAQPDPHDYELEFVPKVEIEKPMPVGGGGCG